MADKAAGSCACAWVGRGGALQASFALDAAAAQDCAIAALRLQVRAAGLRRDAEFQGRSSCAGGRVLMRASHRHVLRDRAGKDLGRRPPPLRA